MLLVCRCRSVSISQPLMKCKRVFQALINIAIEELCETANSLVAPVRLGVARPTASFSLVSSNIDAVQVSTLDVKTNKTDGQPFNALFSRTLLVSWHLKGRIILDHMQVICTLITMPAPRHSFCRLDVLPGAQLTVKALKAYFEWNLSVIR